MDRNLLTKFFALIIGCFFGGYPSMAEIREISLNENPIVSEKYMLLKVDQGGTLDTSMTFCDEETVSIVGTNLPAFAKLTYNGGGNASVSLTPLMETGVFENVYIVASDSYGGNDTIFVTILVNKMLYRVNSGGPVVKDLPMEWATDMQDAPAPYLDANSANYTTGSNMWTGTNITGAPDLLFGDNRLNLLENKSLIMKFPVPQNGKYKVNLYFAQKVNGDVTGPDQQIFHVKVEDLMALENFDIYAEAGMNAIKKTCVVDVNDKTLNINFFRRKGNPQVNAIEIFQIEEDPVFVEESSIAADMVAIPNPTADKVQIRFKGYLNGIVTVAIYDERNRIIFRKNMALLCGKSIRLNLEELSLASGEYYVQVLTSNKKYFARVMLLR
ncbi:malectin domain-containing carbohydrate-binding protein [Sporocytophaga myxococcoides]|uniref:malectin domain-containing carbohydrate-binding protein n=1 Tax=Sporocytophaga myxococcoides TaxID=153721 RepID=UPI00040459E7|nr:malectin domain-containing carbohydrate-binding protein [Sporocytophaga myxococcoides]